MSAAPSEPEKYSIDEMMERLKGSAPDDPENGELVTRSDGTQAIRVRKKKRRTTQPHKESTVRNQRARMIQVSAALIMIFLAALTIGAAVIYANSSPFRDGLIQKISQSTGASSELQTFRMNPQTANAGNISLSWPEGNLLQDFKLLRIKALIAPSSFLGKVMAGEEVNIEEGNLKLRLPNLGESLRVVPCPEELPIRFNRYRITNFNLTVGEGPKPILSLYKSDASLTEKSVSGLPQMRLFRGDLVIPDWPKLRMDRALVEFRGDEIDIVGLRVLHETDDRGSLDFTGTIYPYKPQQISSLTVTMEGYQLSGLTGPNFAKLISGRIDSVSSDRSNSLTFSVTDNPSPRLDIAFSVTPTSRIELQGFPFMVSIAQLIEGGDNWFEAPVFDSDANGEIHKEKGILTFRNLNLISKSRMAIRGDLSLSSNQALSGNLRVGLATAMISKNSRMNSMFGPQQDGFRWIDLKISGSANAPFDNFKDLYEKALQSKDTQPSESSEGGSTFDELTRPRGGASDVDQK